MYVRLSEDNTSVFSVSLMVSVSVVNVTWVNIIIEVSKKQQIHEERDTMQFLFLCIHVWVDLKRLFGGSAVFYLKCCRHKIWNKIILSSRSVLASDSTSAFVVKMTEISANKKPARKTTILPNHAKLHQRAPSQHNWKIPFCGAAGYRRIIAFETTFIFENIKFFVLFSVLGEIPLNSPQRVMKNYPLGMI